MSEANEGAARRAAASDARDIGVHQAGEKPKTGQDGASPFNILYGDQIAAQTAEIARLRKALRSVEEWWLSEGMRHFDGAPYAMFAVRGALGDEQQARSAAAWEREYRWRHWYAFKDWCKRLNPFRKKPDDDIPF